MIGHRDTYGFSSPDEPVELVSVRLKASQAEVVTPREPAAVGADGESIGVRRVLFKKEHWVDSAVFRRASLASGQVLTGPAIIEQQDATILIYPDDRAIVDRWGNLIITLEEEAAR